MHTTLPVKPSEKAIFDPKDELASIPTHNPETPMRDITDPTETKKGLKLWGWLALVAISFLLGRFVFNGGEHAAPLLSLDEAGNRESSSDGRVMVTTDFVAERPIQRTVNAVGTLHAYEEINLASKLEGRVTKIHYDVSSIVQPGEVLLELDSTDARLAVEQAERSLKAEIARWGFEQVPAESDDLSRVPAVVSAKYRYELAKSRYDRMVQLLVTKAISDDDFEQAKSEYQVSESEWRNQQLLANAAAATARLRAADLAIAKQRLSDCKIRVPEPTILDPSGIQSYVVSERMVSEGTLLRPGTEVFRLVFGKTLKLRLFVPETYSDYIKTGQHVEVFPGSSIKSVPGTVSKVAPSVDRATRTFLVEVEVPNENGHCKPGGFAKASIFVGGAEQAITVPNETITSLAGIQKIFVVKDGIAHEVRVKLGEQSTDWVEIAEPQLDLKTEVVTSGQRLLSEGMSVSSRARALQSDAPNDQLMAYPLGQGDRK